MAEPATLVTDGPPAGPEPVPPPVGRAPRRLPIRRIVERREAAIFVVAVGLFLYFALSTTAFVGYNNFVTLTQFLAPIAVIGAGEAVLLTAGEVDLSAGTAFIFFPFVFYYLTTNEGLPVAAAIIIALVTAALFGMLNGMLTTLLELPSFVTTLGSLFALDGIMEITSNGTQFNLVIPGAGGSILGVYSWSEVLWALGLVVVVYLILHRSRFGIHVVASGGNLVGAAEAGVKTTRVKIWAFVLCSTISALIGIVDASRLSLLDPGNDGSTEMFYAIAAAVIGGTALTGGRGTIVGAAIGSVVLGILYDGMYIKGVNAYWFQFILGAAILAAMVLNVQLRRAAVRHWRSLRR